MWRRLFGPPTLFLYDDGGHTHHGRVGLLDQPPDTLIQDSIKKIRDQLAQVPPDKKGALVIATDWKWGVVPTVRMGWAQRVGRNWEIAGDAFISKTNKGASVKAAYTW